MSALLWVIVPLTPLLFLITLVLWSAGRERLMAWLWLAPLPALLAALFMPTPLRLGWLWPGAEWGLGERGADPVGQAFLAFSAVLWGAASLYGWHTQRAHPQRLRYWVFWLLALAGNVLLIVAQDGASFYVGFTLMSLAAYGLVVHNGGPAPRHAGRVYLQLAILGEVLIYAGLVMRVFEADNAVSFAAWLPVPTSALTGSLLIIGFGLKAGFFPLHIWLPLAHPAAPAAASAVLSGAMIKAGVLGLWRFLPEADPWLQQWAPGLVALGLSSALFGVLMGLYQVKIKTALAYSSVSQVGYLLVIIALAWLHPEQRALWAGLLVLFAVHHGLAKGALFMGAGLAMQHRFTPWQWLLMVLPAVALAGLPMTSGGVTKTALKSAFADSVLVAWLPILSFGSIATALLMARVLWLVYALQPHLPDSKPPTSQTVSWALVTLLPLGLLWFWPRQRAALIDSTTAYATWALLWPLLIALGVVVLVLGSKMPVPERLLSLRSPAPRWAFWLKQRWTPAKPFKTDTKATVAFNGRKWERRWNRFWPQRSVETTLALILAMMALSWLW